jgi:hypothetical protein
VIEKDSLPIKYWADGQVLKKATVRFSFLPEVLFVYLLHISENPHFLERSGFAHHRAGGTVSHSNSLAGVDKIELSAK